MHKWEKAGISQIARPGKKNKWREKILLRNLLKIYENLYTRLGVLPKSNTVALAGN